MRDDAGLAGCNVTEQMGNNTLREVICCGLVVKCQLLQLRGQPIVAADDSRHKSFDAKVVQSLLLAVALTCRVNNGQITGMPAGKERFLDRHGNLLGVHAADKAGESQSGTIFDVGLYSFCRCHNFDHSCSSPLSRNNESTELRRRLFRLFLRQRLTGEHSLALIYESAHALDLVGVCKAETKEVGLIKITGNKIHFRALIDSRLGKLYRIGAVGGNFLGQGFGGIHEFRQRNDQLYKPDTIGLVGLNAFSAVNHQLGHALAD